MRSRRRCLRAAGAEHENAGADDVDDVEAVVAADGKYRPPAVLCTKADAPDKLARSSREVVAAAARFMVLLFLSALPSVPLLCFELMFLLDSLLAA